MHVWSVDPAETPFIERLRPPVAVHTEMELDEYVTTPPPGEVRKHGAILVVGQDLGSHRHANDEIGAAGTRAVRTRAPLAARSAEVLGIAEVD